MSQKRISRTRRNALKKNADGADRTLQRNAGYGRLSLVTEDTTSPERQREVVEGTIAGRGGSYDPAEDYYEDLDKSAYDEFVERPGFNRLMASLDQYDVIVVYRLDRVSRRIIRFMQIYSEMVAHDVVVVSATEPFDTSSEIGKAIMVLLATFAEMESEAIGTRVQGAQQHMVKNGRYRGGQRPFGWEKASSYQPGGLYFKLNEDESPLLLQAVLDVIARTRSIRGICIDWNDAGVLTARGNPWSQGTLSHLLRNEVLIGHGVFGETLIRDDAGKPLTVAESLVDEPTWYKLQDVLNGNSIGGGGVARGVSLLGGIATCALCGRPLRANARSYICPSFNDARQPKEGQVSTAALRERDCVGVSIERRILDAWFLVWLVEKLNASRLTAAKRSVAAKRVAEKRQEEYHRRCMEISAKLDRLEEDRYDGLYDDLESRRRFKKRREDLTSARVQLDAEFAPAVDLAELLTGPLTVEGLLARDIGDLRRFIMNVTGTLKVRKGTRGSRKPASERVDAELVEALQGGRQFASRSPRTAQVS